MFSYSKRATLELSIVLLSNILKLIGQLVQHLASIKIPGNLICFQTIMHTLTNKGIRILRPPRRGFEFLFLASKCVQY